jgi:uncharacterized protein (TIGR02391 family)
VIDEVKVVSKIPDDGDSLMNKAFGCDNKTPVIQFNNLATDSERDEQKGFFFLFKGIVGLRNAKAHSNTLFEDALRGHDYLALASVLMRVLEIAAPEFGCPDPPRRGTRPRYLRFKLTFL